MRSFALLLQLVCSVALFAFGAWVGSVAYRDNSSGLGLACFFLCVLGICGGDHTLAEMKRTKEPTRPGGEPPPPGRSRSRGHD